MSLSYETGNQLETELGFELRIQFETSILYESMNKLETPFESDMKLET